MALADLTRISLRELSPLQLHGTVGLPSAWSFGWAAMLAPPQWPQWSSCFRASKAECLGRVR